MERQKVQHAASPAYPTCAAVPPRIARSLALATALCATPLAACDLFTGHVDGLMVDSSEGWSVRLPEEGTHTVALTADAAELDYHLDLDVHDAVIDCLTTEADERLLETDAVLEAFPAATFAEGADLTEVEAALTAALAQGCDAPVEAFLDATLVVEDLRADDTGDTGGCG
jgi:hypothetical protein